MVHAPWATKKTVSPSGPTVQVLGVEETTYVAPSPLVPTVALKPANSTAPEGMLVTTGVDGVALRTPKDCALPVAPMYVGPCATLAVREQVPEATKLTVLRSPPTVQTPGVFEKTT